MRAMVTQAAMKSCTALSPAYETVHEAGAALSMHRHGARYVSLVVAGSYVEVGLEGPLDCIAGVVVMHPEFHAHGDRFGRNGARTLNVELPTSSIGGGVCAWHVDDLDEAKDVFLRAPGHLPALLAGAMLLERSGLPPWQVAMADEVRDGDAGLGDIARDLGVSPEHASRALARSHGMSPRALRREARWRRALRLLESELPLAEVAVAAGFSDQSHLCRVTLVNTGSTPGRLRQRIKCVQDAPGAAAA